jgi:hypothetical protein
MTHADDKAELYELVALLHGRGWTTPTIAYVLAYSDTRVRFVLADLGLHHPVRFESLESAIASLDVETADRIMRLRHFGIRTSTEAENASGA